MKAYIFCKECKKGRDHEIERREIYVCSSCGHGEDFDQ